MSAKWLNASLLTAIALATQLVASQARGQESAIFAYPGTSLTFSAGYIAEDKGFWAEQGLTVKPMIIAGLGATNSVIAGSSPFAFTTAGITMRAIMRGQEVVAIANTVQRPLIEIVLRKDIAPAFDPNEPLEKRAMLLKGRTIAVDAVNSITHGYLKIVAQKAGLDPDKDITVTPLQPPSMIAALKTRSIDGFTMSQPWTLSAVEDGLAVRLASSPRGDMPELVPFAYNVVLTRPKFCSESRSVCQKMALGIARATAFIVDHPDEAMAVLRKRFPQIEERAFAAAFQDMRAATPRDPVITELMVKNAEFYNVASGLVPKDQSLKDFSKVSTNEFLR